MLDTHLLNIALAALGIGAGAAILVAVAIVAAAAIYRHLSSGRRADQVTRPTRVHRGHVRREPALR